MRKLIEQFILKYGILHRDDESIAHIEMMCDDHMSITWDEKDYYIPVDHSDYDSNNGDDSLIHDYLETLRFD